MKKWCFLLSALLMFCACDSENSPVPPIKTDPESPEPREPKLRQDIPLTATELQLAASSNTFAYSLYSKMRLVDENTNMIMSPLSVSLAFSMLNNGAAGISQEEIQKVLGFEGYQATEINSYFKKMIEAAAEIDPQVILESANSIWVNNNFPVLPQFISVNQEAFGAEIRNEDFHLPATLEQINNWASEKTHGKIPTILNELDPATQLILMNALYFLGDWRNPFEEDATKKESFTTAAGKKVKVDMMNAHIETHYAANNKFSTIRLPYGNGAFYMQLILPQEGVSLADVTTGLENSFEKETTDLTGVHANVELKLPKFKINSEFKLNEILEELGMVSPFDPTLADFSRISNLPLFVSFAKQKATIDVNEKGSEAAAVTVIGMDVTAAPSFENREFHANRPFIFLIREISTNAIFFMGEINKF